MSLRVFIQNHNNSTKVQVELPENIPMARLLPVLAERMNLPLQINGQPVVYRLDHERTQRRLDDNDTLASAQIARDDMLRLLPEVTAGNLARRRLTRLANDYEALKSFDDAMTYIEIESTEGDPPEAYIIRFDMKGIARVDTFNRPIYAHEHRVRIELGIDYPVKQPYMRWLTEFFHPNVSPQGTHVCIDAWYAARTLDDLVRVLSRMINFDNYNPMSALNRAAAAWAVMNAHLLPLNRRGGDDSDAAFDIKVL
jgi:ubiquitin-protein ligase